MPTEGGNRSEGPSITGRKAISSLRVRGVAGTAMTSTIVTVATVLVWYVLNITIVITNRALQTTGGLSTPMSLTLCHMIGSSIFANSAVMFCSTHFKLQSLSSYKQGLKVIFVEVPNANCCRTCCSSVYDCVDLTPCNPFFLSKILMLAGTFAVSIVCGVAALAYIPVSFKVHCLHSPLQLGFRLYPTCWSLHFFLEHVVTMRFSCAWRCVQRHLTAPAPSDRGGADCIACRK